MQMSVRTYSAIWLAVLAVGIILLVLFQSILLPFVAGMAVAYFLDPVADRLEKAGLSRTLATSIITAAFIIVVGLFLVFVAPLLQAQIVDLLRDLQSAHNLAYLFISHDLKVVRALADEVIVMRGGKVIEQGPADGIFDAPQHEYTQALIKAAFDIEAVDSEIVST